MNSRYIETNGIRLHVVAEGKGPLMLLLHGFPEFWYSWRHQIPEFAKDHFVVAPDLRGYNLSDRPAGKNAYRMDAFMKDVEGLIRALGYEKCILVAHDWGGAIAWNFAYHYPGLVERLIMMNMPHPADFKDGLRTFKQLCKSWYVFAMQPPWLAEAVFRFNDYRMIEQVFRGWAVHKSAFTDEDIKAFKEAAAKPGALTAMVNYYRNVLAWKPKVRVRAPLPIPTLLIWGEQDRALGKELTHGIERYVPGIKVHYIPDSSHWVQQEKPEEVNRVMREFLRA